ncbi:MAG TPA: 2-amino-4-hydroxy-6-hydroxymethyldihydropteridine diphosphokinase [Steroidobacteraceae bacterium]|nr:2-amino-4-hydroxy-6-hydroxymethyldihydropteridine diphosphokinase [Steroidobacteraceae bacterium]
MDLWRPAYIGVGSNLEDPRAQVLRACLALERIPATRLIRCSPLYGSVPLGAVRQPDFVNAVAGVLTQLEPHALLAELRAIEAASGRPERHPKWGPRVIDLDLLVFAGQRLSGPELTVPHPGVVDRNFVLYPLADIAPDLDVPGLGRVTELKARVGSTGLHLLQRAA